MSSNKGIEHNGWCIVTGQDFREHIFFKDPLLPKIPNPDYDPSKPEDLITNRKEIYQPKDLTGYDAKMDIRIGEDASTALLISLTVGNGLTFGSPDPVDGSLEFFIDNVVTKTQAFFDAAGIVFFDLFLIPPGVGVDNQRVVFGEIEIVRSRTDV